MCLSGVSLDDFSLIKNILSLDDKSISLGEIFLGAAPFAVMMVAVLFLVIAFPILTTALL